MALIITATNFSAVAQNAAHYACQLAAAQNASVIVIHSFVFPVMFSDLPFPANLINDADNDLNGQMKKKVDALKTSYPELSIQGIVIDGDFTAAISELVKNNEEPWLVVIGNSASGADESFENTMFDTFRNLKYPVLAIPPEVLYTPVKNICLALDNKHSKNEVAFNQVINTVRRLNAELEVLNAQKDAISSGNLPAIDIQAQKILEPANPHFHVVYDVNVNAAIEEFVGKNNIDWLLLIPRKYSFFEGLFHKSHSKAMAHRIKIPIMALHEEKEA